MTNADKQRKKCNRFVRMRNRDNIPKKQKQAKITDFFGDAKDNDYVVGIGKTSHFKMNCYQINNQKKLISTENISRITGVANSFMVLGQEPSSYGSSVTGLNPRHTVVQAATERPRAYIYCHKNLNAWQMNELCSKDTAACIVESKERGLGTLLFVSIYWDGRIDTFPKLAIDAMELARKENYVLIMGDDANARNTLFGSGITCSRGRQIEDLLIRYDLAVCNKGKKPTCTASDKGSIIDITLSNGELDIIQNWKVSDLESYSDHRIITFDIMHEEPEEKRIRKMNPAQKEKFTRDTRGIAHSMAEKVGPVVNVKALEDFSSELIMKINKAHVNNSNECVIKVKERPNIFSIPEVKEAQQKFRALKHQYENARHDPSKKQAWKKQENVRRYFYGLLFTS